MRIYGLTGIHKWNVTFKGTHLSGNVGICDAIPKECQTRHVQFWRLGVTSYFYGCMGSYCVQKNGSEQQSVIRGEGFSIGAVISVQLDCNEWRLTFLKNDKTIHVQNVPKQTYYRVISSYYKDTSAEVETAVQCTLWHELDVLCSCVV